MDVDIEETPTADKAKTPAETPAETPVEIPVEIPAKTSSETESDYEEAPAEAIEEEARKKPVPLRRPSELHTSAPEDAVNGGSAAPLTMKYHESPPHIMDHCYAKPSSASKEEEEKTFETQFAIDHGYTRPRTPPRSDSPVKPAADTAKPETATTESVAKKKLQEISQNRKVPPAQKSLLVPRIAKFKKRDQRDDLELASQFKSAGIDLEDSAYLEKCYNMMLNSLDPNSNMAWLHDTHWVAHPATDLPSPPKKRKKDDFSRPHLTGSCRTEGYYKMDRREKMRTKFHLHRDSNVFGQTKMSNYEGSATKGKLQTAQNLSREARSNQRRQLAIMGDEVLAKSDLLKFNQLKFRRKQMTFGKSAIHDWGLFAQEDIGADEMVIEYVGQVVRPTLSDVRENRYERQGIGSSYLFRIDLDYVVDATKCGNLARFINHSCDPNCYAKVITVENEKKIVIYSKQPIAYGEEITYDYKFPLEDEKIRCLCGAKTCRKYLN